MNIGIDVDGVLVDMEKYQLKYGKKFFLSRHNINIKNPKAYDVQEIFDCTKEEREKFWKKYIWSYCLREPMTANAAETIDALRKAGHKIFIITGRAHTTEKGLTGWLFRKMLLYWLKKNKLYYDEIIFCSEENSSTEKLDICLKKHIDLMIDDKPENLFMLKDKIKILCYPAAWNEDNEELDNYRIECFEDILYKV